MTTARAGIGQDRPHIVIVGAGISGLAVASLLAGIPARVTVLEQVIPPGRKHGFAGIVSSSDLEVLETHTDRHNVSRIGIVDIAGSDGSDLPIQHAPGDWQTIVHRLLLDELGRSISNRGVAIVPDGTVTGFAWHHGAVSGVRNDDTGAIYPADLIVLADESSPRLPEALGLRPDWAPVDLMHLGKRRYPASAALVRERLGIEGAGTFRVLSMERDASWGSPGWGLVIPGGDAITLVGAMTLEDAMVSTRHITEYLDELERLPAVRDVLAGLSVDATMTEVVPIGGFDRRHNFHADRVIVANDLVGVTHPLNRDGLSANLAVCAAAARTIHDAVAAHDFSASSLRRFTDAIASDVISPVNAARRSDRRARSRPPWLWASRPDLFPLARGVTAGAKSETLGGVIEPGVWRRLRRLGRAPGSHRHAPGEHDE